MLVCLAGLAILLLVAGLLYFGQRMPAYRHLNQDNEPSRQSSMTLFFYDSKCSSI